MKYRIYFTCSDAFDPVRCNDEPYIVECEDFVQITYEEIRTGPNGDPLAHFHTRNGWTVRDTEERFSDVVVEGMYE